MVATVFIPGQPPRVVAPDGFVLPDGETGFARVISRVAEELGCSPGMEDILDCGLDFVAYTISDYEGELNHEGTLAVQQHSKYPTLYGSDDDTKICGPLLLVTRQ